MANVTQVAQAIVGGLGFQFLKTNPPQEESEMLWLALPMTIRILFQIVATLSFALFAFRFLLSPGGGLIPSSDRGAASAAEKKSIAGNSDRKHGGSDSAGSTSPRSENTETDNKATIVSFPTVDSSITPPVAGALPPPDSPIRQPQWRALALAAAYVLVGVVICAIIDRWHAIPVLVKIRSFGADSIIAICIFVFASSALAVTVDPKDATTIVSAKQTDEWKGSAMLVFLLYHYWDWKQACTFTSRVAQHICNSSRSLPFNVDLFNCPSSCQPLCVLHGVWTDPVHAWQRRV